jgi:hypothetical protein
MLVPLIMPSLLPLAGRPSGPVRLAQSIRREGQDDVLMQIKIWSKSSAGRRDLRLPCAGFSHATGRRTIAPARITA